MATFRLWHPAHDAYHCAFRLLRILSALNQMPSERLFILDFYLLYPFLLHRCAFTESLREKFAALNIVKPDKQFLSLPSPQVLYRDLRVYQRAATVQLAAKGLLDPDIMVDGYASLRPTVMQASLRARIEEINGRDGPLINFLVHDLSEFDLNGPKGLYQRTKLPRRIA